MADCDVGRRFTLDGRQYLALADLPPHYLPQVAELYASQGWGEARSFDLQAMGRAFRGGLGICALDNDRVLGLARGFSDGWQAAWLAEIIVHPDWAGLGVGQALAREFMRRCGTDTIYCEALSGRELFFERLGFKVRHRLTAMAWRAPLDC
ncbi:GNAT family N-acetyltransferase [Chromobacterium vaccinii]|uniref:GNAT family N-acetyltransferase n=1 Tax=Chromobacterium vaccinii TaxID=1108595 RepID=UPI001E4B2D7B|nr:GNAT family N-acetyltransferase [Chromobacterium vaccinii]MCD4500444.1 GNAT family N-acetyltransferase [Chromobacterium vaccinii]